MSTLNIKEFLDKDEQKDLLRFLTAGSVDDVFCLIVKSYMKISWMLWSATVSVWEMPAIILTMHCYWMA